MSKPKLAAHTNEPRGNEERDRVKRHNTTSPRGFARGKRRALVPAWVPLATLAFLIAATAVAPAAALAAPSATTNPATAIHHTSAVLNGHLDPDVDPGVTGCSFEWGPTIAYGNTAPCNEGNAFAAPASVSANVNNLTPGTAYHFRLHVETTSNGPFDGADRSFRPDTFPLDHPEIGSFGPDGTSASSFSELFTVAFDQPARELFALDRKASAIFGFDASSPPVYTPLTSFNPLSVPGPPGDQPDIAVDGTALASAGNVYYVAANNFIAPPEPPQYKIYGYSSSGSPLPGFPVQTATGTSCGAAVDSAGHLWVANHESTIEEFSSAGAKLGSIGVAKPFAVCKLAFDSNDDMYVVGQNSEVWKYTAASGYASGTEIAPRANNNVAVDTSTHDVYVAHYVEENSESKYPGGSRVYEYDSAGHLFGEFALGVDGHIAVDSTDHNVFIAGLGNKIHVFDTTQSTTVKLPTVTTGKAGAITGSTATIGGAVDPEGMPVTDCHIGWGRSSSPGDSYEHNAPCSVDPGSGSGDVSVSAEISGLAAGTEYDFRVFASNADGTNAGKNVSFVTHFPPSVSTSAATNVTDAAADLNGHVDPKGFATTYRFEWGPTPAYGNVVPVPDGNVGSGEGNVAVSAHIAGLAPNTRYFWRLSAESLNGSTVVEGDSFLTLGGPIAETVGAPMRTTSSAQLGGRVSPRGFATTYLFEYGTEGPCDSNPCTATAPQSAGSGALTELVSEEVTELEPGTTYHYRVVAESAQPGSPAMGSDMTVTTRLSEAPLSHGHFPGPPGSDRAYEQVSPPDTGGNPVNDAAGLSADGNRAVFQIAGGTSLSEEGNLFSIYFAHRVETGSHEGSWEPKSILPPRNNEIGNPHWFLIPDARLSTVVGMVKNEGTEVSKIWRLDPNAPASQLAGGEKTEISLGGAGVSDDGSRLMTQMSGSHDPEHPASKVNLYDLTSGTPHLESFLPDGSVPACGLNVRNPETPFNVWVHAISADGSLAFFESRGNSCSGTTKVYLRDLLVGETKLVSTPPLSGPECDASFLSSSPDAVFIWSKSRLSAEDSEPGSCADNGLDGDVYRYDFGDEMLKCVTCVAAVDVDMYVPLENGQWRTESNVLVAEEGSRVYFQSPHALVPGAPTVPSKGSLYRVNVNTGDLAWVGGPGLSLGAAGTPATADGATLLIGSEAPFLNPLNGTDNAGTRQLYRYDDRDRSLVCVSCPGDGSAPRGGSSAAPRGGVNHGLTQLSRDGKTIAFSTPTPMVGADQNTSGPGGSPENGIDVYEWRDGRYFLITDGLSNTTPGSEGPAISGMSDNGHDIFFVAPGQYTPDALDGYRRLYDARIGGGFNYPTVPPPCPLEVCQGTPKGAPEERAPGTGSFAGPGNAKPPRAKHKKHRAKKHRHKAAKKHAKNRVNDNRGTAR
jgi:hypothetical protein